MEWITNTTNVNEINNNFKILKDSINKLVPSLYNIDLYNVQGQITPQNMSQNYARLPYNSALIWFLDQSQDVNGQSFLGKTYHNGDYILKLGNDTALQIVKDTKGTFVPSYTNGQLTYSYSADIPNEKVLSPFILQKGNDGASFFSCIRNSTAISSDESIDTGVLSSALLHPLVTFFSSCALAADNNTYNSFNTPILIDYTIAISGTTWWISFPDGAPICSIVIR